MEILYDVSDDLLSISSGDVAAYEQATSTFVSSFRSEATDAAKLHPPAAGSSSESSGADK